jgi:hypothetical protein
MPTKKFNETISLINIVRAFGIKLNAKIFTHRFERGNNLSICFLKEDPLQHGYSRVNQQAPEGTLSNSTTSTSLDTVVIDTSTDNISNSPKFQQKKQKSFSPILETEDSNLFSEDLKELALRSKKSNLKGGHISFGEDDEETDKFDEEAFKKKREHFQKTKSRSEHKSLILRVSISSSEFERHAN